MPEHIPCRCLLKDFAPDMAQSVREVVESLDETQRTPEDIYRSRLDICLRCPSLRDGTCALCGCYVEARAAYRGNRCPDIPPRWEKMLPSEDTIPNT